MAAENPFAALFQRDRIKGRADSDGTAFYFQDTARSHGDYRPTSWYTHSLGLNISRLGCGGYRMARGNRRHFDALREAFITGTNLYDTATNYADGASESLCGDVMRDLIAAKRIERDQLLIISKAGYIQGSLRDYLAIYNRNPPTIQPYPELEYSLDPDFLEEQLELSRARIGVETVDIYLLQNPEYYLIDALKRNIPYREARELFRATIHAAFRRLEEQVLAGKIQYYGISSNRLAERDPALRIDPEELCFSDCPRFRVLQFPGNLLESQFRFPLTGAAALADSIGQRPFFTLANRPFQAMDQRGGLVRLARLPEERARDEEIMVGRLDHLIDELVATEERIVAIFAERHFRFDERSPPISAYIRRYRDSFATIEELNYALPKLVRSMRRTLAVLQRIVVAAEKGHHEREAADFAIEKYSRLAGGVMGAWEALIDARHHQRLAELESELAALAPELNGKPLTIQGLLFLLAADPHSGGPLPHSVLAGMRDPIYVKQLHQVYSMHSPIGSKLLRNISKRAAAGAAKIRSEIEINRDR